MIPLNGIYMCEEAFRREEEVEGTERAMQGREARRTRGWLHSRLRRLICDEAF